VQLGAAAPPHTVTHTRVKKKEKLAKKKEMFGMNERSYLSFEYSNRVNKPNSCNKTEKEFFFFLKRRNLF
jgi:hypothetical protein